MAVEKTSLDEFKPGEPIQVGNFNYVFLERETWKGKTYLQEGAQALVAKVKRNDQQICALKAFKPNYRKHAILERLQFIKKYSFIQGMDAANSEVVDPQAHIYKQSLSSFPFLQYANIMPWVPSNEGTTWSALRSKAGQKKYGIPKIDQSIKRAKNLARILMELNKNEIAHCDICPKNIVVAGDDQIYLIDLENFYHKFFKDPPPWGYPEGQEGYRHPYIETTNYRQYCINGDNFGGALLIAELLAWYDPSVRDISLDECYIPQPKLQTNTNSFQLLYNAVTKISSNCGELLKQAWRSKNLEDCPSFMVWDESLRKLDGVVTPESESTNAGQKQYVRRPRVARRDDLPKITEPVSASKSSPHYSRRVVRDSSQLIPTEPRVSPPPIARPTSTYTAPPIIHTTTSGSKAPSMSSGKIFGTCAGVVLIVLILTAILGLIIWLITQSSNQSSLRDSLVYINIYYGYLTIFNNSYFIPCEICCVSLLTQIGSYASLGKPEI